MDVDGYGDLDEVASSEGVERDDCVITVGPTNDCVNLVVYAPLRRDLAGASAAVDVLGKFDSLARLVGGGHFGEDSAFEVDVVAWERQKALICTLEAAGDRTFRQLLTGNKLEIAYNTLGA